MKIKIDHLYIRNGGSKLYINIYEEINSMIENENEKCVVRMSLDDVGEIIDNYIEIDLDKLRKNGEKIYKFDGGIKMPDKVYYIICIDDINCRAYYPENFLDLKDYGMPAQEKLSISEWTIKKLLE